MWQFSFWKAATALPRHTTADRTLRSGLPHSCVFSRSREPPPALSGGQGMVRCVGGGRTALIKPARPAGARRPAPECIVSRAMRSKASSVCILPSSPVADQFCWLVPLCGLGGTSSPPAIYRISCRPASAANSKTGPGTAPSSRMAAASTVPHTRVMGPSSTGSSRAASSGSTV